MVEIRIFRLRELKSETPVDPQFAAENLDLYGGNALCV